MRKPDELGIFHWLIEGINIRWLVLVIAAIVGSHFAQSTRITVVEQAVPGLREQVLANKVEIDGMRKDFVDINRYNIDQQNLELQLTAIRESQDRILGYLVAANQKGH